MGKARDGTQENLASMERTLERFPIGSLAKSETQEIEVRDDAGNLRWLVSARRHGKLPSPFGQDVYVALCKIYNDTHRPESRKITTTLAELCRIVGRRGGGQYDAMREALRDLKTITITAYNVFRVGEVVAREKIFNLLDDVTFDYIRDDHAGAETKVTVTLSEEVATNIREGVMRLLDVDTYYSFSRPVSKRLFRYLDMRRWRGKVQDSVLELPLMELRRQLPLETEGSYEFKRTLDRGHDELQRVGYLGTWEYIEGAGQGLAAWRVRYDFDPGEAPVEQAPPAPAAPKIQPPSSGVMDMHRHLLDRLGDEHSAAFYFSVAKKMPHDVVENCLGIAKADGDGPDSMRRIFTSEIRKRAVLYGVEL